MTERTEELFREDAYLKEAQACVQDVINLDDGAHGVLLDRTIFYPLGGGQPGDTGHLIDLENNNRIDVIDTRKNLPQASGEILHLLAPESAPLAPGAKVSLHIDWERRYKHMRMHSCMHLLSAILPWPVTGGQVGAESGRVDFDIPEAILDKQEITEKLNQLIQKDNKVTSRWITAQELADNPSLVKTMSVKPPTAGGRVRLIEIENCDLQPCGGTHVKQTAEIGKVEIRKIEKKGAQNRRVRIAFL